MILFRSDKGSQSNKGRSPYLIGQIERRFVPHAAPQTRRPSAACRTTDKWAYCRTPHHRQVGLLPHAAPQTNDNFAAPQTNGDLPHHMQEGLSPLPALPHCKQVGLKQLTANQTENTGGDSQCGSDRYARPKTF